MTLTIDTQPRAGKIRAAIGRKTPDEIRAVVAHSTSHTPKECAWLAITADRLERSGYLTLADVTDDEFEAITAE